jgi:hypothetical protein
LRGEDQPGLLGALDGALDGVGAELVGGLALVDAGIFSEAVLLSMFQNFFFFVTDLGAK